MDTNKVRKLASEIANDYDLYCAAIITIELGYLELNDDELEAAIDEIMKVYRRTDYATVQGVACAYASWIEDGNDDCEDDDDSDLYEEEEEEEKVDFRTFYGWSDWR